MSQKERKCTAVPPPTGVLKRRSRGSPKSQVRSTTLASKTIIRVLTDRIEANTAAKIAEYTTDVAIESLWSKAQYHVAQRVAFAAMSNQPFDDDRLVALVIFQVLPDCAIPVDLARAPGYDRGFAKASVRPSFSTAAAELGSGASAKICSTVRFI